MGREIKGRGEELFFASGVYSPEAVRLAAYVYSDRADIRLADARGGVAVSVSGGEGGLAGELANEALNQQCRLDLAAVNGKISEMIVTKALLSALGGGAAAKPGKKAGKK